MIQHVPEITDVIGKDLAAKFVSKVTSGSFGEDEMKSLIKEVFGVLMAKEAESRRGAEALLKRLEEGKEEFCDKLEGNEVVMTALEVVKRVANFFPGDAGILSLFLLNYLVLEPYEAIFLGPNIPHAYLSGNCVEITACSDNVVRAGCTPKFRDINALVSMLTYQYGAAEVMRGDDLFHKKVTFEKDAYEARHVAYRPPIPDFQVERIELKGKRSGSGRVIFEVPSVDACSIVLVIEGKCTLVTVDASTHWLLSVDEKEKKAGTKMVVGSSVFVSGGASLQLVCEEGDGFVVVRTSQGVGNP